MFLLNTLEKVLLVAFLVASMLSLGLQTTPHDLRTKAMGSGRLLRALLANFVLVPLLGLLMARWLIADAATRTAFLLLACTPGGISMLQFTTKAKGESAYAGVAAILLSLPAVVVSPLLLAAVLPAEVEVALPFARAIGFLLLLLVLPLLIGLFAGAKCPFAAPVLAKGVGLLSLLSFVAMVVILMAPRKEAMGQIGGQNVVWLLVFIGLAMVVGWLLGGPGRGSRQVLASATSMRNVALALAIAVHTFPESTAVLPPLIAFSALMVPPNLIFTIACLILGRRRQPPE